MDQDRRRAWVEVDLGALTHNAQVMAERARVRIVPMIKADAYGLGAIPIAHALECLDPWGYGVATVVEGDALRRAGIERPILVMTPLLEWDFPAARQCRLTPVLGDPQAIAVWCRTSDAPWHLSIDTGMHRAGLPWNCVGDVREIAARHPPEGACTHYHSADVGDETVQLQEARFREAVAALPVRPGLLHAECSPWLERHSPSPWNLVRPGVFLYGAGGGEGAVVRPMAVVSVRARIVSLRDVPDGETVSYSATYRAHGTRRIATAALGYADGYRRALSNRGSALVHGRRVPVAGLVTMDMTMLDVTGVDCRVGDMATFIGRDGDEDLDVNEVARTADMSPYELLAGLRQRLPRIFLGGQA
ncbi:MAG: Alanine racemase [Gemmatimonadaceae bacterium]|nr:Alanine racemase [Gemmatimonadaceae bacterium]